MFTVGAIIDRPQTTAKPKRATNGRPYKRISAENLFSLPICVIMRWVMKMDKEKELPKRKPTRLKNFDYSSAGAYFVTICIRDRMNILSEIVKTDLTATDKTNGLAVGEGLAHPEIADLTSADKTGGIAVGEGLAPPEIADPTSADKTGGIAVGEEQAPPLPWMM